VLLVCVTYTSVPRSPRERPVDREIRYPSSSVFDPTQRLFSVHVRGCDKKIALIDKVAAGHLFNR